MSTVESKWALSAITSQNKNGRHIGGTLMFSSKAPIEKKIWLVITCLRKKIGYTIECISSASLKISLKLLGLTYFTILISYLLVRLPYLLSRASYKRSIFFSISACMYSNIRVPPSWWPFLFCDVIADKAHTILISAWCINMEVSQA